ncbi:hypothetical protein MTR67_039560 [Solanum verrucosum]|uniref:Uncharacterized protein n=1 Tax=Solanum verrucosum TaxID=315347 RepID=A0AAF0ZQT8_SOLVR|nr:hypothetical protein MTR67_039560 [Solanum verrucosum]
MIKVTINDRVELTSYQLKDVAHIWFTRYDLPSSYAFQIKPTRKAYPRNANAHNANVVLTVPSHKALLPTNNNFEAAAARVQDFVRTNSPELLGSQVGEDPKTSFTRGTDAVPITWECFRYDLPSSYAFHIKPPGKAYPRNANTHNAAAWAQDFVRMNAPEFLGSQSPDPTNNNGGAAAAWAQDFVRMNPPEFPGSQFFQFQTIRVTGWRRPQNFIDEVKKIFGMMKVTINDRVELSSYQLKDVAHIWFSQWKNIRGTDVVPITLEYLSYAFQIKPRRIAYPRNTNAHNAYTVHPIPNHKQQPGPRLRPYESTIISSVTGWRRPQNFIDEVKKIFEMMKVTINDWVEFTSYQLKDVAHIWFTQWKENRGTDAVPINWERLRYDLPSSYAFQIRPPRKAYPRNADTHNANAVPPVPEHKAPFTTKNNVGAAAARVQDFVRMNPPEFLWSQFGEDPRTSLTRYDLPSSYAFQIKPRRKAYPRNANAQNANAVPPVPDNKVSNVMSRNTIQLLVQSVTNQTDQQAPVPRNNNVGVAAARIKPRRIANPRNTNAHNANTVHPIPNHKVWNVEFRHTIQLLVQSVTNQTDQQAPVPRNNNVGAAAARVQDFVHMNPP